MSPPYAPYKEGAANTIYNLLFCDAIEDFAALQPHFPAIFDASPDEAVRAIAEDAAIESRVRCIAYQRLRREGAAVAKGVVLGVIAEVALDLGLDTLAAYADGRVRYINQAGGMSIIEETHQGLVATSVGAGRRLRRTAGRADRAVDRRAPAAATGRSGAVELSRLDGPLISARGRCRRCRVTAWAGRS
ncbi:MAG: hypothetical protein R3C16_00725 [Hyphomonadaceae bacterium]